MKFIHYAIATHAPPEDESPDGLCKWNKSLWEKVYNLEELLIEFKKLVPVKDCPGDAGKPVVRKIIDTVSSIHTKIVGDTWFYADLNIEAKRIQWC